MPLPIAVGLGLIGLVGIGAWKLLKFQEAQEFNNGICRCGGHFKKFPIMDTGVKGYDCDVCKKVVIISFDTDVDYKYIESDISKRRREEVYGGSSKNTR